MMRANPFPKVTDLICRLPLLTLFYSLEATNLGDLMRLSVRPLSTLPFPWFFMDRQEQSKHNKCRAIRANSPVRQLTCFPGTSCSWRKKKTFLAVPANITKFIDVAVQCQQWYWNVNQFPFHYYRVIPELNTIRLQFRID